MSDPLTHAPALTLCNTNQGGSADAKQGTKLIAFGAHEDVSRIYQKKKECPHTAGSTAQVEPVVQTSTVPATTTKASTTPGGTFDIVPCECGWNVCMYVCTHVPSSRKTAASHLWRHRKRGSVRLSLHSPGYGVHGVYDCGSHGALVLHRSRELEVAKSLQLDLGKLQL